MKNYAEARNAYAADRADLVDRGVILFGVQAYIPDGFRQNFNLALDAMPKHLRMAEDAQPVLAGTVPNSAVPWSLTNFIDPTIIRVLFAPTNAEKILGTEKKGDWTTDSGQFPIVEHTGEVSSYDDYSNNGSANVNANWPARQNYLFQTVKIYGEREVARAGLAKINWVQEVNSSAIDILNRFMNLMSFFGIGSLQNYGLLNDPNLTASLTPALKAYGGVKWINNGIVVATANEIYADIQALYIQLVNQSAGNIDQNTPMVLAGSPQSLSALTATNSFNVNVSDLLKKNFPNIRIEQAVQYGSVSASNPQGVAAGNEIQLIATEVAGQKTGSSAFSEKLREHPLIKDLSAYKQKCTAGGYGAIIRVPLCLAQMVGV